MLVDNSIQPSLFSQDIPDFSDIFHTELFGLQQQSSSSSPSSALSSGSSPNSPESDSHLLTPPQPLPPTSFPSIASENSLSSDLFDFGIDEELKALADPLSYPPPANVPYPSFDFLSFTGGFGGHMESSSSKGIDMCIDPILVDSPAPASSVDDEEEGSKETDAADAALFEHVTQPVKVAGHGNKGRKGTVQSGSVTKKAPVKEKENSGGKAKAKKEIDDDDELPADWRPPPEVYAKMSSKEKRQLRNKISARNFRVRRKEYITTLEGDIAERDQLLSAVRSELGSSRSENMALRHEIAALKKALLSGRGSNASLSGPLVESDVEGVLNLPPPAPLPAISAAEALANAAAAASNSPSPFTPNTQKDLPTSGTSGRGFWGGAQVGLGGGYTPVHTAIVSAPTWPLKTNNVLQENLNPALNGASNRNQKTMGKETIMQQRGFDGFADMNPFTMKTLDAYRMQLWGKMAAQQQQQNQQQGKPTGLAGNMRPSYFATSAKHNISSAALAGKSTVVSPSLKSNKDSETMLAAMASQTFTSRLGNAFWDAFSGSGSSSRTMDTDKVRKVLEGKAVVRVVDVDPTPSVPPSPKLVSSTTSPVVKQREAPVCSLTDILEESMRSLSIGKKH